jgi:hypothetical protein
MCLSTLWNADENSSSSLNHVLFFKYEVHEKVQTPRKPEVYSNPLEIQQ